MINLQKKKQTGFTLLELIVVISLLGLVTSLASDFVINETNQQRFETTKQRLAQIRYAIIGDTSASLNGQPIISGFIADTGKLPESIRQLITPEEYCTDFSIAIEADCTAAGESWRETVDNWKGPYLTATGYTVDNTPVFVDSWGNTCGQAENYGWNFSTDSNGIKLQSLGLGNLFDSDSSVSTTAECKSVSSNTNSYENEYPLKFNDYFIPKTLYEGKAVTISVPINTTYASDDYCILYSNNSTAIALTASGAINTINMNANGVFEKVSASIHKKIGSTCDVPLGDLIAKKTTIAKSLITNTDITF
jgi:prepilin-type N-terminal cleavage/methylation domain-containing protein